LSRYIELQGISLDGCKAVCRNLLGPNHALFAEIVLELLQRLHNATEYLPSPPAISQIFRTVPGSDVRKLHRLLPKPATEIGRYADPLPQRIQVISLIHDPFRKWANVSGHGALRWPHQGQLVVHDVSHGWLLFEDQDR